MPAPAEIVDLVEALDDYVCAVIQREAAYARADEYGPSAAAHSAVRKAERKLSEILTTALNERRTT